jgi:HlyD family secretion protein
MTGAKWMRAGAWSVAGVLVAALLVWAFAPQPVAVDTAVVGRGAFRRTVDEDGKTRVRERYVVSAPLAGRLLRVELKPGAAVERGTLLATLLPAAPTLLDARTMRELSERLGAAEAERARAGAAIERAVVALGQAQADLHRAAQLAQQGFVSKENLERGQREVELKTKELKLAEFDGQVSEHQVAVARAALTSAREASPRDAARRWAIRSPVSGQVLRVLQESETMVQVGAPIMELGDPHDLEVVVDVLTADAAAIRPAAEVELDHGGSAHTAAGRVRLIEPAAFTKVSALGVEEQRVNVVIDFESIPDDWRNIGDAHRVDARIIVERRKDVLTLPVGATFRSDGGWATFVVHSGRAKLTPVKLGPRGGRVAVVDGGVAAGDRVIVYPSDSVRDGVRVQPRG